MEKNILLIQKEKYVLNLLTMIFTEAGYSVFSTDNIHEAVEIIRKTDDTHEKINLILISSSIAMKFGSQFLKKLFEHNKSIPILVLSEYENEDMFEEIINNGYDDFIQKSSEMNSVEDILDKLRKRIKKDDK